MKILRLSVLLAVGGAALAGTALFWTSQNVQRAEADLRRLERNIKQEKQAIRVLRAEWDYLNTPERLEEMATHYLKMIPQDATTLSLTPADLPDPFIPVLPPRKPHMASGRVQNVAVTPSRPAAPPPAMPQHEAPSPHLDNDFRALLNNIKKGGAQ